MEALAQRVRALLDEDDSAALDAEPSPSSLMGCLGMAPPGSFVNYRDDACVEHFFAG